MAYNPQPKLTEPAIALIKHMEGCRLDAYRDACGVWTIGYGHTQGVHRGMTITQAQAEHFLLQDLKSAQKDIARWVKVPLSNNEFGALVSLVFNIGGRAFRRSTCLRQLNGGDRRAAANAMELFVKGTIGGRKRTLRGLERRRHLERALFDTADGLFHREGLMHLAGERIALDTHHSSPIERLIDAVSVTPRQELPAETRGKRNIRKSIAIAGFGSVATAIPAAANQDSFDDVIQHVQQAWQELMSSGFIPTQADIAQWWNTFVERAQAVISHLMNGQDIPSRADVVQWFEATFHNFTGTTPDVMVHQAQAFADSHAGVVWLGGAFALYAARSVVRHYVRNLVRDAII